MGRTLDFTDFSGGLTTQAALIYDAIHLFAVALSQVTQPFTLTCSWKSSCLGLQTPSCVLCLSSFLLPPESRANC